MALVRTTLASAVAVIDTQITVASATSIAAGRFIRVDDETMQVQSGYVSGVIIPVLRGRDGSATLAHPTGAGAIHGDAADMALPAAQSVVSVDHALGRVRRTVSYSLTGALDIPEAGIDMVAILTGTTVRAMTLAVPGVDKDGDLFIILGNGKAAHTVTVAGGIGAGGSGYTVLTFDTNAQCCVALIAANGVWVAFPSPLSGTLTGADVAVA